MFGSDLYPGHRKQGSNLNQAIDFEKRQNRLVDKKFQYIFVDQESGRKTTTDYRLIAIEKLNEPKT
jgi:hypothetical protein